MSEVAAPGIAPTLAVGRRRQRFALAAELCSRQRVALLGTAPDDPAAAPLAEAARELLRVPALSMASADGAAPDALVWLDGVPAELAALDAEAGSLEGLARSGVRLLVAVPNALANGPASAPLARGADPRAVRELARRLEGRVLLQNAFEVAVLALDGEPADVVAPLAVAEPRADDARHLLVAAGFPDSALAAAVRMVAVAARPVHAAQLAALEAASTELRGENARLAREQVGVHDAAAAAVVARFEQQIRQIRHLESEASGRIADLERRLEVEMQVAVENDRLFQNARARLEAPRHRMVDAVSEGVGRIPVVGWLCRRAWRLVRRVLGN